MEAFYVRAFAFCCLFLIANGATTADPSETTAASAIVVSHYAYTPCDCVSPEKCYNQQELSEYVKSKSDACRAAINDTCEITEGEMKSFCVEMMISITDDCEPQTDEYVVRQVACAACKDNCTSDKTAVIEPFENVETTTTPSVESYPVDPQVNVETTTTPSVESYTFEPKVNVETTTTPNVKSSIPISANETKCVNKCGVSGQCNLEVGPDGMLEGQRDSCKTCVKDECADVNENPIDGCNFCGKLLKMLCYEEAMYDDCWTCNEPREEDVKNLEMCEQCVGNCFPKDKFDYEDDEDDKNGDSDDDSDDESDGESDDDSDDESDSDSDDDEW